ncbi:hypothetical protein CWE15_10895 [Aliidiomarina taiwanensis]|uniref:Translocation and assembly module TamB C-terminal domain-containing protein n=1 Tax=Aliidiomarina taiwanensis TaxID=946228 RepID=A0A432WVS4_9GAMM|nr:translocation/assembly module TamB domain-containing protein [Aliidiomarina taiwanensis]RUO37861.1 hypothetical protein CWE15_10895 [Aliidiomarina taiwanensis]
MKLKYPLYWLVKAVTYLVAAAMVLLILLLFLLNTEPGSRFTLDQAQRWVEPWVQYESFEGALLHDFTLQGVEVTAENGTQVYIQSIRLRWWPWQLLQQQAHIRLFDVAGVEVQLATTEASSDNSNNAIVLPHVELNFNVRVDQLLIENASIHMPARSFQVHRLQTRGRFENNQLRIHDFQLSMPEGHAQLQAKVTPQGNYPVNLEGQVHTTVPQVGPVSSELHISGNVQEALHGRIELTDNIGALIEGQINQATSGQPRWQLEASVYQLNHPTVAEYVSEFTLQFDGAGNLAEARGNLLATATAHDYGFLSVRSTARYTPERIEFDQLQVNASELALDTNITGTIQRASDQLTMQLESTTLWADYPELAMQLSYQGSTQHVDDLSLTLSSERGHFQLTGAGEWRHTPRWDLALTTENAQLSLFPLPKAVRPYLAESQLTSHILSQGVWGQAEQQLHLEVKQLNTTVEQQALSVQAQASLTQQQLSLSMLEVTLGDGAVSATAQGTTQQFEVQLAAEQFTFMEYAVDTLTSEFSVDTTLTQLPTGHIQFSGLRIGDSAPSLAAEAAVTFDTSYSLEASLTSEPVRARLALTGDWQQHQWQGQLTTLDVDSQEYGRWTLPSATAIAYSAERALVEPFCLRVENRPTHICAELGWHATNNTLLADLDINQVELSLLGPLLPNALTVEGAADIQLRFQQQDAQRNYQGEAFLHDVGFRLPAQDIHLRFANGELFHFQGDETTMDGRLGLTTDAVAGGLQAEFSIQRPFDEATIDARATLDFNTLTIVSILVPDIQNVEGKLDGSFNLSGPLFKPAIGGTMTISEGAAEVPAAGLQLSNFNVLVESPRAVDAPFLMSATARSGEGDLFVTGQYDLANHLAEVNISGSNFTAMNSREIQLVVSPDAQVRIGTDLLQVRGELNVDHALITPPDFDSVQLASADTMIVRGDETLWQNTTSNTADVDIQVSLGNDFQVAAYGFEGQLTGQLRVIEKPNQETTAVGTIQVEQGEYELYGQSLTIERGNLVYTGGVVSNPGLDLRVSRTFAVENVTVGARIGGALQEPRFNLYSTPTMQDAEILSYLAFGRGFGDEKSEDENMLLKASLALGMQGGNLLGERLSASLGVDEIMLDAGDTLESTSLYIGKHLSPRLYIQYGIGLVEPVNTFFIRYRLTDYLNFETQTGTLGSGADLFYSIER